MTANELQLKLPPQQLPRYYLLDSPSLSLSLLLSLPLSLSLSLAVTFVLATSLFAVEICPQTATIAISSLSIVCSLKISGLEKARTSSKGEGRRTTKGCVEAAKFN